MLRFSIMNMDFSRKLNLAGTFLWSEGTPLRVFFLEIEKKNKIIIMRKNGNFYANQIFDKINFFFFRVTQNSK